MKRLVILLIMLPIAGYAQVLELGIGLGGNSITQPSSNDLFRNTQIRWTPVFYAAAKCKVFQRFRLGIEVSRVDLARQRTSTVADTAGNPVVQNQRIYVGSPAYFICPTLSVDIQEFYCGLHGGVVTTANDEQDFYSMSSVRTYCDSYIGYVAGGHWGFNYRLGDHVYLFTELRTAYIQGTSSRKDKPLQLSFWNGQLIAGLHCYL